MHSGETEYLDAEEMSASIKHADVVAVQISKGKFRARHKIQCIGSWSMQYVSFFEGTCACAGQAPPKQHGFLIPMRLTPGYRLLGSGISATSIGIYAPGSEHADVSSGGTSKVVIVPPAESPEFSRHERNLSGAHGSRIWDCPPPAIERLRAVLSELELSGGTELHQEVVRSIGDTLSIGLREILAANPDRSSPGRPPMPRTAIIRRLLELLETTSGEPVYAGELASILQISDASLRRAFIE